MKLSRKKSIITSTLVLMIFLLSNIFAFSGSNFKPKYGITTANVNLRKEANLDYSSIITTIPKNTNLKIVGEVSSYYIVQLTTNEVGLISKEFITISGSSLPSAKVYENFSKYLASVKVNSAILRGGPGTNFNPYGTLKQGTIVEVIGKIDEFLMVVTENNKVGMIREDLLNYYSSDTTANILENNTNNNTNSENITDNIYTSSNPISELLTFINNERNANGLPSLAVNDLLQSTAQTKAEDMVKNSYFSHTSPTYGSPFDMMKNSGILYKTAGENIAGNPSIKDAFDSWMNSEGHRDNILSNAYNYVGIGVEKSEIYGYIIVVMFIGK